MQSLMADTTSVNMSSLMQDMLEQKPDEPLPDEMQEKLPRLLFEL